MMASYTAMDANETFLVAPEESRSFQMVPRVSCSMSFRVEEISDLFVGSERGGEPKQTGGHSTQAVQLERFSFDAPPVTSIPLFVSPSCLTKKCWFNLFFILGLQFGFQK